MRILILVLASLLVGPQAFAQKKSANVPADILVQIEFAQTGEHISGPEDLEEGWVLGHDAHVSETNVFKKTFKIDSLPWEFETSDMKVEISTDGEVEFTYSMGDNNISNSLSIPAKEASCGGAVGKQHYILTAHGNDNSSFSFDALVKIWIRTK
jgi:hypothetical protein